MLACGTLGNSVFPEVNEQTCYLNKCGIFFPPICVNSCTNLIFWSTSVLSLSFLFNTVLCFSLRQGWFQGLKNWNTVLKPINRWDQSHFNVVKCICVRCLMSDKANDGFMPKNTDCTIKNWIFCAHLSCWWLKLIGHKTLSSCMLGYTELFTYLIT